MKTEHTRTYINPSQTLKKKLKKGDTSKHFMRAIFPCYQIQKDTTIRENYRVNNFDKYGCKNPGQNILSSQSQEYIKRITHTHTPRHMFRLLKIKDKEKISQRQTHYIKR